jgi:DNA-binding GntR family transcriptional regulator
MPEKRPARFPVRPSRRHPTDGATPLAQAAYAHLMQQLLEGALSPGDRLSVVDLAGELSCSRVPVMEALKRLDAEGFVEIIPQVGCRVARPDASEVADFFELFASVEGCVTRLAAARRSAGEAGEFKVLCTRIDRELKAGGGPETRDPVYRRLNLEFHSAIHALARAPLACAVAAGMWDRSDFFIKVAFGSLYFSRRVRQAHAAIRRAIVEGDPSAAEAAIERHLRDVGAAVATRLRSAGN